MPKKKKGGKKKKGSGGGDAAAAKPSEAAEAAVKQLQRVYAKTLSLVGGADNGQKALPSVDSALKTGAKAQLPVSYLIVDNADLSPPPAGSCRLRPLLQSIRNSGYPYLRQLYLWHVSLQHKQVFALSEHLAARNDLEMLELMDNQLDPAAGGLIGQALGGNHGLKSLRILFNNIGTRGFEGLCAGVELNDTLKRVSICHCDMDVDAGAIAGAILPRVAWSHLTLDGNRLRAAGLAALASGLAGATHLEVISLQENEIDVYCEAPDDLLTCLERAKPDLLLMKGALSEIDLSGNHVGEEAGKWLLELQTARKEAKLKGVKIKCGPQMSADTFAALAKGPAASGKKKGVGGGKKKGGKKKKKKKK